MDKKMKTIQEISEFLNENVNEYLFDIIKDDLKIEIDNELSCLYDQVRENKVDVSFEDIVRAVINRVKIAISTFYVKEKSHDTKVARILSKEDTISQLKYIAESPPTEHGGFHSQTSQAARSALFYLKDQNDTMTTILKNVRRLKPKAWNKQTPNWVLIKEVFGVGASKAFDICNDLKIDGNNFEVQ